MQNAGQPLKGTLGGVLHSSIDSCIISSAALEGAFAKFEKWSQCFVIVFGVWPALETKKWRHLWLRCFSFDFWVSQPRRSAIVHHYRSPLMDPDHYDCTCAKPESVIEVVRRVICAKESWSDCRIQTVHTYSFAAYLFACLRDTAYSKSACW